MKLYRIMYINDSNKGPIKVLKDEYVCSDLSEDELIEKLYGKDKDIDILKYSEELETFVDSDNCQLFLSIADNKHFLKKYKNKTIIKNFAYKVSCVMLLEIVSDNVYSLTIEDIIKNGIIKSVNK